MLGINGGLAVCIIIFIGSWSFGGVLLLKDIFNHSPDTLKRRKYLTAFLFCLCGPASWVIILVGFIRAYIDHLYTKHYNGIND